MQSTVRINYILIFSVLLFDFFSFGQDFTFPFGQKVSALKQIDTTRKSVFVLGVYASAVHAKWLNNRDSVLIGALAVASEPYIFWTGDSLEAQKIIARIKLPKNIGRLVPSDFVFNGPSGRCLDSNYLNPLNYKRENTWLCDLIPYSCQNQNQKLALSRVYDKYIKLGVLPQYSIPEVPDIIASEDRVNEILIELKKSLADTIILLGDQPLKYFLSRFTNKYQKLSDIEEYGKPFKVTIAEKEYVVFALAHPRQVSKLGQSNQKWYELHQKWLRNKIIEKSKN
jgi:hypothetical protein